MAQHHQPLEELIGVIQELAFARDLPTILAILRRGARQLSGADGIAFILRDGAHCHYVEEDAIGPLWKGQRFPLTHCVSGLCMLTRQPIVIDDIYQDPRVPHAAYRPTFVKSLAMVPIRASDPLAALGAYWAARHRASGDALKRLQALAEAIGLALANVELYANLEAARLAADRANAAKTRFLAAASHDLRQPLQAQLLLQALLADQNRDPALTPVIAKLGQSLTVQQQMLDTLLDLSRLDAGIVAVQKADFPIGPLLERLAQEFAPQAQAQGLTLTLVRSTAVVHSDPALLDCMLRNLLSNALKYTDRGRILLGCRRAGPQLSVQVWDTGHGIPTDQQAAIFEAFSQLGNPARDRRLGFGLGLAIVDRLAKLMGHQITVRSVLGQGSVFAIAAVPLAPTPVAASPLAAPPQACTCGAPAGRRAGVITIVEDDAQVREALALTLTTRGYAVIAAGSLAEAVARCQPPARRPDVIVADYRLGHGQTGSEAIGQLRRACGARIPGILLTGDTSPERLKAAQRSGLTVLHKPIQADDLIHGIEQALLGIAPTLVHSADEATCP